MPPFCEVIFALVDVCSNPVEFVMEMLPPIPVAERLPIVVAPAAATVIPPPVLTLFRTVTPFEVKSTLPVLLTTFDRVAPPALLILKLPADEFVRPSTDLEGFAIKALPL